MAATGRVFSCMNPAFEAKESGQNTACYESRRFRPLDPRPGSHQRNFSEPPVSNLSLRFRSL